MKLHQQTACELLNQLQNKSTTSSEIYTSIKEAIDVREKKIKAFLEVFEDPIENRNEPGLPIAVKANICIKNRIPNCASKILNDFRSPYDATVIEKLKERSCLPMGYANMDEFAFGSSTENSCEGPSRNPWNINCVPGGSSGGSAAAVAADEAIWALGSDTGGSIRQPASFCGVIGVKPTYGRVSRYGLIAFASSLDQIGPITKNIKDAALLLEIIAGYDPKDSTSVDFPVPQYSEMLNPNIKGLKIGFPKEYFVEGLSNDVRQAVNQAMDVLKTQGAQLIDISLPHTEYAVATYYILATAEASSNLARFDGVQYGLRCYPQRQRRTPIIDLYEETRGQGFGSEAKRRIMLGTYALSSGYYDAYYLKAQKVRTLIKSDFDQAFKELDVIVTPTSPTTAFEIGERSSDPLAMYLSDIYTISANLAGIPALSLPCGFDHKNMPIGLQIMAKPFDEPTMFNVAYAYEQKTNWRKQKPSL